MEDSSRKHHSLNRVFLRRFWCCMRIIFPGFLSTTFLLFVLLIGLSLAEQILVYYTGLIPSQFYEVLCSKDKQGFRSIIPFSLVLIVTTAVAKSLVGYVSSTAEVKYRHLLTRYLHELYFKDNGFYDLNVLDKSRDNPDKRMTSDILYFCLKFKKVITPMVPFPFIIVYYTYKCYIIAGFIAPISIYGYFIFGAIINKLIMSPIIALVVKNEKLEGDFRFKHMQIRENAECVAFCRSGPLEEKRSNKKLHIIIKSLQKIVNYSFFLDFSVDLFDQISQIISYIVIAVALFSGTQYQNHTASELVGEISKNLFVSTYLMKSFTNLINLSGAVSNMAVYTHRIGELVEYFRERLMRKSDNLACSDLDNAARSFGHSSDSAFSMESLSYTNPKSLNPLVSNLFLTIRVGENVLITGNSGSGKTSLFRVLGNLWKPLSGQVHRNIKMTPNNVLILPQRVLLSDGTLKQQVIYPYNAPTHQEYRDNGEENDDDILKILHDVGLANVCDRFGGINVVADGNWEDILSPGEMQRVAFARLFYHKPVIALLDEATSALDVPSETSLYEMCRHFGITVVSIGHRESLVPYHDMNLRLDGEGGWTLNRL